MSKYKVAAVQVGSKLFDTPSTIRVFEQKLHELQHEGVDLAVFPEAFIGGYPKGIDFEVRMGMRQPDGREQFRLYHESAVSRQSAEFQEICNLVEKAGINVVLGVIEKDGGTLYCSSAAINRKGQVTSWHRKLMPTAMEKIIWGMGDGSTMQTAEFDVGRASMAICWENYMPLYRAHLYSQRTQIHCAPTVDDRDVWLPSMQMIALEGRCFVISACQFMTISDVQADWYRPIQGNSPETVLIRGGSCIISPMGEVLAAPIFNKETICMAMIDLDEIVKSQFDLDAAGHYTRPDIFCLNANTTKWSGTN